MAQLNRLKVIASAILLAVSLLFVQTASADSHGAGSVDAAPTSTTLTMDRINETGVVRVGVSGAQPPFSMKTRDGDIIGLDVDLGNALASAMGVRAEIVVMDFAELIPAVEAGRIDIARKNFQNAKRVARGEDVRKTYAHKLRVLDGNPG